MMADAQDNSPARLDARHFAGRVFKVSKDLTDDEVAVLVALTAALKLEEVSFGGFLYAYVVPNLRVVFGEAEDSDWVVVKPGCAREDKLSARLYHELHPLSTHSSLSFPRGAVPSEARSGLEVVALAEGHDQFLYVVPADIGTEKYVLGRLGYCVGQHVRASQWKPFLLDKLSPTVAKNCSPGATEFVIMPRTQADAIRQRFLQKLPLDKILPDAPPPLPDLTKDVLVRFTSETKADDGTVVQRVHELLTHRAPHHVRAPAEPAVAVAGQGGRHRGRGRLREHPAAGTPPGTGSRRGRGRARAEAAEPSD